MKLNYLRKLLARSHFFFAIKPKEKTVSYTTKKNAQLIRSTSVQQLSRDFPQLSLLLLLCSFTKVPLTRLEEGDDTQLHWKVLEAAWRTSAWSIVSSSTNIWKIHQVVGCPSTLRENESWQLRWKKKAHYISRSNKQHARERVVETLFTRFAISHTVCQFPRK